MEPQFVRGGSPKGKITAEERAPRMEKIRQCSVRWVKRFRENEEGNRREAAAGGKSTTDQREKRGLKFYAGWYWGGGLRGQSENQRGGKEG